MKNFLFLLCFLTLLAYETSAQQYTKIPTDTNHYWRQYSTCGSGNYHYQVRYAKDTIIDGLIYNKYSPFGSFKGTQPCAASYISHGFLRQDTISKKVFILDNNYQERPLYNFSKTVGDTMQMYDKLLNVNLTVTVIAVSGNSQMISSGPNHTNAVMEGVGSAIGGLYGHRQRSETVNTTEVLICHARMNPFLLIATGVIGPQSSCNLVTGINDAADPENPQIKIFPNPVTDKLKIEYGERFGISATLTIHDCVGRLVYTKHNFVSNEELDLKFLNSGIYYLEMANDKERKMHKVVRE